MSHPPGWYAMPGDSSDLRYWWDGTGWTGESWLPPPQPLVPEAPLTHVPATVDREGVNRWLMAVLLVVVLAFGYAQYQTWEQERIADYQNSTYVDLDQREPRGIMLRDTITETEQMVAEYPVWPDDAGSYVESGQAMVRMFGAELRWGNASEPRRCNPHDGDVTHVIAWYCEAEPYIIMLNLEGALMPSYLYDPGFIDTVKHELAHHIIHQRCGTVEPPVARNVYEGVTNSYAVIYLNADRGELALAAEHGFLEYEMTAQTDAAATRIHSGDCG